MPVNPCMILCPHHLHNYPDTIYYEVACELFDEYGTASLEVRRARPPLPYGNNMGTFFPPTSSRHFRHICSRQILAILLAMIVEPQRFALQNQSFLHAIPPHAWRQSIIHCDIHPSPHRRCACMHAGTSRYHTPLAATLCQSPPLHKRSTKLTTP
jgi:hypothetical protein